MIFPELRRQGQCVLLLAAVVNILYFNTYLNSFHFDDGISIVNNSRLKDPSYFFQLFSGLKNIFSHRPLVQASFLVNYQFCRLHVFGYHLFNLCAHAFAVVLVFFVSLCLIAPSRLSLTGHAPKGWSWEIGFSFLAALIFAIHPIQTESVTYISSRSEILMTIFFLLTLLYCLRWHRAPQKRSYPLFALIFFLFGMATKQNFIVFPLIALLYFAFFHPQETWRAAKKHAVPLITFAVAAAGIAFFLLLTQGEDLFYFSTVERQWTPWQYLYTEINVILYYYFKKLCFPLELSLDPHFPSANSFLTDSLFSFFILAGLAVVAVWYRKKKLLFSFGLCWILLGLSPTSSFVPLLDFVSEHRLYLPAMGMALAFASLLHNRPRTLPLALLFLILSTLLSLERNNAWRDTFSIWSDAARKAPLKARPFNNLAKYYMEAGKYQEALAAYQKSASLSSGVPFPYTGMGGVYMKLGDYPHAEENFKKALQIRPHDSDASTKLAQLYFERGELDQAEKLLSGDHIKADQTDAFYLLGQLHSAKNRPGAALREFFKAMKSDPDFAEAYVGVGIIYAGEGKFGDAEKYFLKALEIRKNNPDARLNLGYLHFIQKEYRKALEQYDLALEINPKMSQALIYAGDALLQLKEYGEAQKYLEAIPENEPQYLESLFKRGLCLLHRDGMESAIKFYSRLPLNTPEGAMLYFQVGRLLESMGQRDEATPFYDKAAHLDPGRFSKK